MVLHLWHFIGLELIFRLHYIRRKVIYYIDAIAYTTHINRIDNNKIDFNLRLLLVYCVKTTIRRVKFDIYLLTDPDVKCRLTAADHRLSG